MSRRYRLWLGLSLLTGLLWCAGSAGGQTRFTLEQLMSSAFPTELVAAPSGGRVAWVLNSRGVRNIWVAAPPEYKSRRVTGYAEDDGQQISDLRWTPATVDMWPTGCRPARRGTSA